MRHWNPVQAGALGDWDARFLTGYGDAVAVDTWASRPGVTNNAVGVTTSRPTYRNNAINGQPGVRFDGVNDQLLHSTTTNGDATTILCMKRISSGSGYQGLIASGAADTTGTLLLLSMGTDMWGTYAGGDDPATTKPPNGTGVILCMVDKSASGGNFYYNGAADGTYTGNTSGQSKHFGGQGVGSQNSNVDFLHVAIFQGQLALPLIRRIQHGMALSFKISCS